ncbi:hypothetical protein VHEMI04670 [[Torrubiella] hemipterigena]|uniref:Amidase domain-containing protein n=1 Tax=[Torrubiella] hemipterigena TaxID=1531966 RepID=A0A0A1T1X3_9HYPO|nr:hypothetical protein VHEMI04670 [[Torrubiella] hemipterigena]
MTYMSNNRHKNPHKYLAAPAAQSDLPTLLYATIDELRDGLDKGKFTSVHLTKAYIKRIEEVSQQLKAVIGVNTDALTIAAEKDKEREKAFANNIMLPLLHGIPVNLKDNIGTNDKMDNTAGSFALVGAKLRRDSTMAANLRKAGAIILAKDNLSQWAHWRGQYLPSGWSSIAGQCVGAFGGNPMGSSSGGGVVSAVGLTWASLGTETAGSIIYPAWYNNVVGIKPTIGLTSRYLVVPISGHHDTVGPMARTVKDAAALLNVMAGKDSNDKYTSLIPNNGKIPDYVAAY